MSKLVQSIRDRRLRQEKADRVGVIFRIFIDPVTKKEATDVPRQAVVIGGPRLQQEANETAERFEARVRAIAHQLRNQNEQVA
jgi:hypothetical protein